MKNDNSKNKIVFELANPDDIQDKKDSIEGKVYQMELENIGKEIAKLQYNLAKWNYLNLYKTLRYKEFLGFTLTAEENEQLLTLEENKAKFEIALNIQYPDDILGRNI